MLMLTRFVSSVFQVQQYHGKILLAGENDDFRVVEFWENLEIGAIQTPQEVFLHMTGLSIAFCLFWILVLPCLEWFWIIL